MDKVQQFRRRAGECKEQAALAASAEIKTHYLGLASMWEKLADERLTYLVDPDFTDGQSANTDLVKSA